MEINPLFVTHVTYILIWSCKMYVKMDLAKMQEEMRDRQAAKANLQNAKHAWMAARKRGARLSTCNAYEHYRQALAKHKDLSRQPLQPKSENQYYIRNAERIQQYRALYYARNREKLLSQYRLGPALTTHFWIKHVPEAQRAALLAERLERNTSKCKALFCSTRIAKHVSLCSECRFFALWLYGWSANRWSSKKPFPGVPALIEVLSRSNAAEKEQYLCLKNKRKAQALRKQLLKTHQSRISEKKPGLSES